MILLGDCTERMKELLDNSVDAVVTDPPYGLSFMGKKWDYDVPSVDVWREVLRVLKPGGHLLSFGGTRTYHRMVCAVEDAGFEIRDQLQWLFGSGFPKSLNIGKAIDKIEGNDREVIGEADVGPDFTGDNFHRDDGTRRIQKITKGQSKWEGWGTALKPANEPIVLARKPLSEKTVAENVLKWGTGAINIDGSRIAPQLQDDYGRSATNAKGTINAHNGFEGKSFKIAEREGDYASNLGRWPANLLLDEEAAQMLDEQSGQFKGEIGRPNRKSAGNYEASSYKVGVVTETGIKDFGGASRFFYVAKTSKRERNAGLEGMPEKKSDYRPRDEDGRNTIRERLHNSVGKINHHPTVKPIKLMEYLIKLVTPPGGTVLDPFMGSGSTGIAAKRLGFEFIGIEMNEEYVEIAERRIEAG